MQDNDIKSNQTNPYLKFRAQEEDRLKNLLFPQNEESPLPSTKRAKGIIPTLTELALHVFKAHPFSFIPQPSLPRGVKKVLLNGFTVYVDDRPRPWNPQPYISIRLAVKAGYLHEPDELIGLAHLTEHMMFRGTANFSLERINELIESIGCSWGPDVNASTTYTSTVYKIDGIPSQKKEKMQQCIDLLFEFFTSPLFDTDAVERERKIIINELLKKEGYLQDLDFGIDSLCFENSRYIRHWPRRLSEKIIQAPPEELSKMLSEFHKRWYRPDNASIIIAGEGAKEWIESIERLFGGIPAPTTPLLKKLDSSLNERYEVISPWKTDGIDQPWKKASIAQLSHPQFLRERIDICKRTEFKEEYTSNFPLLLTKSIHFSCLREIFKHRFYHAMIRDNTLVEWGERTSSEKFDDSRVRIFFVVALAGYMKEALQTVIQIFKTIGIFGVEEVLVRKTLNRFNQIAWIKFKKRREEKSSVIADKYVDHFVENKFLPPSHYIHQILFCSRQVDHKEIGEGVKKEALSWAAFNEGDVLLHLSSPLKAQTSTETILSLIGHAETIEPEKEPEKITWDQEWLEELTRTLSPKEAKIRQHFSSADIFSWTFPNQLQVIYKPTLSPAQKMSLCWQVPKGFLHTLSVQEKTVIVTAVEILNHLGLKSSSYVGLKVAYEDAQMTPFQASIDMDNWTLTAALDEPAYLETALQMLFLRLTDMTPIENGSFASLWQARIERAKKNYPSFQESEGYKLQVVRMDLLSEGDPFFKARTPDDLESFSVREVENLLIGLLKNIEGGTLIIAGAHPVPQVEALVKKYIGSLPVNQNRASLQPGITHFTRKEIKVLREGAVPQKVSSWLFFPYEKPSDPKTEWHLFIATDCLKAHIWKRIRNPSNLAASNYGVGVSRTYLTLCSKWDHLSCNIQHSSDLFSFFVSSFWQILEEIISLPEESLNELLEAQKIAKTKFLEEMQDNAANWLDVIKSYYNYRFPLDELGNRQKWTESMTALDLRNAFEWLLKRRFEHKQLTLLPKSSQNI